MRVPLASFRTPYQQPRLFALRLIFGNSASPQEPPRSDVKRLPQSALQLQPQSLTRLTTLLPFVVCGLGNGRAKSMIDRSLERCLYLFSKVESRVRARTNLAKSL